MRYTSFAKVFQLLFGAVAAVWLLAIVCRAVLTSTSARPQQELVSSATRSGERARDQAYKLISGPYEIEEVVTVNLRDPTRGKDLPLRIEHPTGDGPFPVIIFSHGAGGSKDCCRDLTRHWASYGYVTIQPTHGDSIKLRRERGENVRRGGAILVPLRDPAAWTNRARDISFLIDSFAELQRRVPGLKGKLDAKRIGVGGHSLGAYTAQLIGGAAVEMPGGKAQRFSDDRVHAVLLLSGQGRDAMGLTEHSWDTVTCPMMVMTGSRDGGAGGQGPDWKKEPFNFSPPGDKYLVFIDGANHMSFISRFAGGLIPARGQARAEQNAGRDQNAIFSYVQIAAMAFWDAYLKADPKAKAYLLSNSLQTYSDGAARLDRK